MSSMRLSEYHLFLKTYCVGHQLLAQCDHKMQQLYLELLCEEEPESRPVEALRALGRFIDQSLCLNQGRLGVLADCLVREQTGPQSAWISIWDYAWVLNEQQQVLTTIGRRAPMLGTLLGKIEDFCSTKAWRKGIRGVAQLRKFQEHAASIRKKMLLSSKENQALLEKMPLVEEHSGVSSFERLMQQIKGHQPRGSKALNSKGDFNV